MPRMPKGGRNLWICLALLLFCYPTCPPYCDVAIRPGPSQLWTSFLNYKSAPPWVLWMVSPPIWAFSRSHIWICNSCWCHSYRGLYWTIPHLSLVQLCTWPSQSSLGGCSAHSQLVHWCYVWPTIADIPSNPSLMEVHFHHVASLQWTCPWVYDRGHCYMQVVSLTWENLCTLQLIHPQCQLRLIMTLLPLHASHPGATVTSFVQQLELLVAFSRGRPIDASIPRTAP